MNRACPSSLHLIRLKESCAPCRRRQPCPAGEPTGGSPALGSAPEFPPVWQSGPAQSSGAHSRSPTPWRRTGAPLRHGRRTESDGEDYLQYWFSCRGPYSPRIICFTSNSIRRKNADWKSGHPSSVKRQQGQKTSQEYGLFLNAWFIAIKSNKCLRKHQCLCLI